jgi:hypothetical protein
LAKQFPFHCLKKKMNLSLRNWEIIRLTMVNRLKTVNRMTMTTANRLKMANRNRMKMAIENQMKM